MGQADGGDPRRVLRLVVRQPAQFRHGEGGDGDGARGPCPPGRPLGVGAVAPVRALGTDQVARGCGAAGVVPQKRRADHPALRVEHDHAVLLATHRQRAHIVQAPGGVDRLEEGVPPRLGIHFRAIGVGGPPLADDPVRPGVDDDDLAGLGGGVDACHVGACAHGVLLIRVVRWGWRGRERAATEPPAAPGPRLVGVSRSGGAWPAGRAPRSGTRARPWRRRRSPRRRWRPPGSPPRTRPRPGWARRARRRRPP